MFLIAPSILSADFANLAAEVQDAERSGGDLIHIDVMDGHFVPNLTFGPLVVQSIRPHTTLPLDVHLMIERPEQYIPAFVQAGADSITVHAEACVHLHRTLHQIKEAGVKAGVALNPATSVHFVEPVLEDVDYVLVMTVNPGFGGQAFIPGTLRKIRELRQMLDERGLSRTGIEVDGGIDPKTAPLTVEAGANILVAGNSVFGRPDRKAAIDAIRRSVATGGSAS
jgi:ribulose-phosphate 3-epimerase